MEATLATTQATFEDAWTLFTREVLKHQSVACALSETAGSFGRDLAQECEQAWDGLLLLVATAEDDRAG